MRFQIGILAALLIGLSAPASHAGGQKNSDEMNAGIIYGEGHAFTVSEQPGWILGNESGVKQGLHAVLSPRGHLGRRSPGL
jgi:hypothetical protein